MSDQLPPLNEAELREQNGLPPMNDEERGLMELSERLWQEVKDLQAQQDSVLAWEMEQIERFTRRLREENPDTYHRLQMTKEQIPQRLRECQQAHLGATRMWLMRTKKTSERKGLRKGND